jgi:hypothetical protein
VYGLEENLFAQLLRLKDQFGIRFIKAEFEAEGASFRDLVRLRRLTAQAGVGLILKIGGCESVRDLRDALELGADGLIAPMIESAFALSKYWEACLRVFGTGRKPRLAFNVETKTCVEALEPILDYGQDKLDGFTIGRSDLSASYFDPQITPDSPWLLEEIERVSALARARGWEVWMGGSLSQNSAAVLADRPRLRGHVTAFETRKVVIPGSVLFDQPEVVAEALKFEELYLLSRQEIVEGSLVEDRQRLEVLRKRHSV